MLFSRLLSLILRIAQFVFSAIVLGLTAYFLHARRHHGTGPLGRTIYALVLSIISVIASLIWMIPFKSTMLGYGSDFFFSAAWFAAFGVMVRWINRNNCGAIWNWSGITVRGNYCDQWRAAQAFSFLTAIVWFATFVLGVITYHRLSKRVEGRHRHSSRV
ncbi:hypothetical protein EJ04DRAFT_580621 [Polyplosphaeria fusca]|uniref:MARVEL domain-containing protein n=1 Tax=Polyplosphaeria fusca TaxID=682080 RepID=A0A9P4QQ90_9PLEO|nr:hypothetical protein EJ04DRAFT_580621 [Polyplosphaeria fusca]